MAARFAGSRSVDERRRRRLAGEGDTEEQHAPTEAEPSAEEVDADPIASTVPGETWMPQRVWKVWLFVVGVVAVAAGAVAGGWHVDRNADLHGPETVRLLGLAGGGLVRGLGTLLLFLAGQLSLVVWWRRSRSTRDFSGRYDVWAWAAAGWFAFALAVGTSAHLAWSETLSQLWEPDFWNKTILSWFVPALGVGAVLWMAVRADARRCRSAWWMLTFAGLAWVAAGAMALGIGATDLGPWRELAVTASALAGHVLGFCAMLLHARFVTHVCCDPPVAKVRRSVGRDIKTAPTPANAESAIDDTATGSTPPVEVERSTPERFQSPQPMVEDTDFAAPDEAPVVEDREPVTSIPMTGGHDGPETEYESGNDGPPPEMLRGLSKRQKKRIRKEWRDRQRAEREAA